MVIVTVKVKACPNVPEREFDEFMNIIESYRPMVVHRQPATA